MVQTGQHVTNISVLYCYREIATGMHVCLLFVIPGSCQRAEKAVEHKGDGDTNCSWYPWNGPQWPGKENGQRMNWDHPDHSTVKINKNTLESLRPEETCHSDSSEKPPVKISAKKLQGVKKKVLK